MPSYRAFSTPAALAVKGEAVVGGQAEFGEAGADGVHLAGDFHIYMMAGAKAGERAAGEIFRAGFDAALDQRVDFNAGRDETSRFEVLTL